MEPVETLPRKTEAWWALGYFGAYMVYHSAIGGETEAEHWLGLVALPVASLWALQRGRSSRSGWRATLASIGLRRSNWRTGLAWGVGLGLAISALQSLKSLDETLELVRSGRALYMYPLVVLVLLLTAGFTEEVFFRGVLQTRLRSLTGSRVVAVLVTSVLFSVYHIPYTYLNPNWPSSGNLHAAVAAAFANGMVGGLVLGALYERSRHNLFATIALHTLINSIPAMSLIEFNFG